MKKWFFRTGGALLSAFILALVLASCANPLTDNVSGDLAAISRNSGNGNGNNGATTTTTTTTIAFVPTESAYVTENGMARLNLWAGQNIPAGYVYVWKDAASLFVKYAINDTFRITEAHIWAGMDVAWINGSNDFAPGQFPYNNAAVLAADGKSATASIPISDIDGWNGTSPLYLLTHAALASTTAGGQTAWGGDTELTQVKRWNRYIHFNPPTRVSSDNPPPVQYGTISGGAYYNGTGLPGVPVTVGSTEYPTVANGSYESGNLVKGTTHEVTAPSTLGTEGQTDYYYLASPASKSANVPATGVDFTYTYETISGTTFRDANRNGSLDAGEQALSATVSINVAGGASRTTGADTGAYLFDHLANKSYTVSAPATLGTEGRPGFFYLTGPASREKTASASGVDFGYTYESIAGTAFYDANRNGLRDSGETAFPTSVAINVAGVSPVTTTRENGTFLFDFLAVKGYTVSAAPVAGFVMTTPASKTVNASATNVDFGYFIDYSALSGQVANGFTIGYWKTNIDKAIANKTNGIQVPAATLEAYRAAISTFALSPLNVATLQEASAILSKSGSLPKDLLAKQLMGSEFNYQNGAFIGGNELATYFFLYQGEYMHLNAARFSTAELLAQKDRYDAYNNSHGGVFYF